MKAILHPILGAWYSMFLRRTDKVFYAQDRMLLLKFLYLRAAYHQLVDRLDQVMNILAFVQEYVTFNSCSGTNGNHNVQCSIHIEGTSASSLTCTVPNPAISGGDNTGDCHTDTSLHLSCVIPPTPGPFLCLRL